MFVNKKPSGIWPILAAAGACAVLAAALLAALPQSAMALPPRPTIGSPSGPGGGGEPSGSGAQIQLWAQFSKDWPWQTLQWQDLWTVVQWQDGLGVWRDVEGWQGTLDEVDAHTDGTVTGYKTWWLGGERFGQGPFRWRIYQGQGGALLATSDSFNLPGAGGAWLVVDVAVGP